MYKSLLFKSALIRKRKGRIRSFLENCAKILRIFMYQSKRMYSVKRSTVITNWRISADIVEFSNNGIPVTMPLPKKTKKNFVVVAVSIFRQFDAGLEKMSIYRF